jgi:hypothetical protein
MRKRERAEPKKVLRIEWVESQAALERVDSTGGVAGIKAHQAEAQVR